MFRLIQIKHVDLFSCCTLGNIMLFGLCYSEKGLVSESSVFVFIWNNTFEKLSNADFLCY